MAEMAEAVTRECPECGLARPAGARDCPCCGCAPGGTGLVDHLPPADADNRLAPVALLVAGLISLIAVLAALAPVAAIAVGACCALALAARTLRRR